MIDICMVTFNRLGYTRRSIAYLRERTQYPFRLIVVDNGSTDGTPLYLHGNSEVDVLYLNRANDGIHFGWNKCLQAVESEFFVTVDNDILCPKLDPCWLSKLYDLMEKYPRFGTISCRPQILVGERGDLFDNAPEVLERPWVGASLRLMRTWAIKRVGGWKDVVAPGRNNEERYICAKLKEQGYLAGYARDLRCWHMFGVNWGYEDVPLEIHGHNRIHPPPEHWDTIRCDQETFEPL